MQKMVGPAGYWRSPYQREAYLKHSNFLSYLSNEVQHPKSSMIKERMTSLNLFFVIRFLKDEVVNPAISQWFGFVDEFGHEIDMTK